ncbi:MAG TPA: GDSL-type esterase/lipase family protein [Gemmatimonadaceae bacterium]
MIEFARYIALGDSMSIDLYPALDAGEVDVAVALERDPSAGRVAPLGAASLLYHNADDRWPEFAGDDLLSRVPGVEFRNLAADGATIGDVFGEQMSQLDETDEPTLVTLTVGGNDLLSAYGSRARRLLDRIENDIADAYDFLLDTLRAKLPAGTFVIATVYDPSDRSGRIPGVYDDAGPLPLDILDRFNAHVRTLGTGTPRTLLADVYAHFQGHGVSAAESDQWYWRRSLVEPNAKGAGELRSLWLETLKRAAAIE